MPENFDLLDLSKMNLDGELVAWTVDEDGDRNRVLEATRENLIRVHWELLGNAVQWLSGSWEVQAHFEGMGTDAEFEVPPAPQPEAWKPGGIYTATITLPKGLITPGTYKIVVTLSHLDSAGAYTRMAGFVEIPMVRFH